MELADVKWRKKRKQLVLITWLSRWAISKKLWSFTGSFSISNSIAKAKMLHSSISATSLSILQKGAEQGPDDRRHFGIAVDDKELVRETLAEMGVELLNGRFMDFLDPWGNRVEITTYTNIQFSKADHVLRGMGLAHLEKTENAIEELTKKGMAP